MAATISEEGYPPSTWTHTDSDHPPSNAGHGYSRMAPTQPYYSRESLDMPGAAPLTPTKSSSPPRSSAESPTRLHNPRWRDSTLAATVIPNGSVGEDTLVDTSFDENVLRALCDLDVSFQNMSDAASYLNLEC